MKTEVFKFRPLFGEIETCEILARTADGKPAVLWTCYRRAGEKWYCPLTRILKPNASHAWERRHVDTVNPEAIAEADESETRECQDFMKWHDALHRECATAF